MRSQQVRIPALILLLIYYFQSVTSEECTNGQFYVNPDNCERFFQCSNGILYELSCPADLYFNSNSETCEYFSNGDTCNITATTKSDVLTTTTNEFESSGRKPHHCSCKTLSDKIHELEARLLSLESFAILMRTAFESQSLELDVKTTGLHTRTTHLEEIADELMTGVSETIIKTITLESKTSELDNKSSLLDTRTTQLEEKSNGLALKIAEMDGSASNFFNITAQLDSRATDLSERVTQLESTAGELGSNILNVNSTLTEFKGTVVTDVRMGTKIITQVWKYVGVEDVGEGYVITGVHNYNVDAYVDDVHKRQFQKRIDGKWVAVGY